MRRAGRGGPAAFSQEETAAHHNWVRERGERETTREREKRGREKTRERETGERRKRVREKEREGNEERWVGTQKAFD